MISCLTHFWAGGRNCFAMLAKLGDLMIFIFPRSAGLELADIDLNPVSDDNCSTKCNCAFVNLRLEMGKEVSSNLTDSYNDAGNGVFQSR